MRPAYFVWLLVPLIAYAGHEAYGLPHIAWSYSWIEQGRGHDAFAERLYTRCTYLGWHGTVTVRPADGNCPWVRFFHLREEP